MVNSKGRQKSYLVALCLLSGLASASYGATLVQTVQSTLETNPQVRALEANFRAATAAVTQAKGGLYPEVTVEAGEGYEGTANPILKATGVLHRNLLRKESSLTATQLLFDGFKVSGEIKQKKALLQASIALLQAQRETVALEVARAYLNVLRRKKTLSISKKNVAIHKQILAQVKKRYASGITTKVDVVLAESRLALAISRLVTAQGLLKNAVTEFIRVTGERPRNLTMPKIPYKKIPKTCHQLIRLAFNQAPVLRAADNNYVAAIENVQVAKAAYYPKFTLDISATDSNNLDGIIGHNEDTQVMFRASYTLFRGGSDMAIVAENRHRMYSAYEVQLNARRELYKKARLAWDNLQTDRDKLAKLKAHALLSRGVVIGYRKQFALGRRALFNVLDAENEAFLSLIAYIDGQYDVKIDAYEILESAGVLVRTLTHSVNPTYTMELSLRPHFYNKPLFHRRVTNLPQPHRTLETLPKPKTQSQKHSKPVPAAKKMTVLPKNMVNMLPWVRQLIGFLPSYQKQLLLLNNEITQHLLNPKKVGAVRTTILPKPGKTMVSFTKISKRLPGPQETALSLPTNITRQ